MMGVTPILKYTISNMFLMGIVPTITTMFDITIGHHIIIPYIGLFVLITPELSLVFKQFRELIDEGVRNKGQFGWHEFKFAVTVYTTFNAFRTIMFSYLYSMVNLEYHADNMLLWALVAIGTGLSAKMINKFKDW